MALALMRYLPLNGRVDRGRINFDGEDMLSLPAERLRELRGTKLGMVYQDPATALNPSIRVGDQIAEVYRFHFGLSKGDARERARGALERVAMPDPGVVLRRYPFQLSGGQQQRVVIAMALAGDPRLLVLDEPTTGLDATVEAEVLDLIEELRARIDAAILLISHNLGLVARMCERVGVMYAGRIVEDGPARELFTDPRHPYTMGLLRCVPRFGVRKDQSTLVPIPGFLPRLGSELPGCVFAPRCELVQPECRAREPDLFAWPGPALDPASGEIDGSARHARCYFSELVPGMRAATVRPAAAAARQQPSRRSRLPARRPSHLRRHPAPPWPSTLCRRSSRTAAGASGRSTTSVSRSAPARSWVSSANRAVARPRSPIVSPACCLPTTAICAFATICWPTACRSVTSTRCAPSRWSSRTPMPRSIPRGRRAGS